MVVAPYAGGLVALLMFLPQINWNSNHDNVTFKFQFAHGFSMDRPEFEATLPAPLPFDKNSLENKFGALFSELQEAESKDEKKEFIYDKALKKLNHYVGYYGSQIGLWGFMCFPVLLTLWNRRFGKRKNLGHKIPSISNNARPLLIASVAIPLFIWVD